MLLFTAILLLALGLMSGVMLLLAPFGIVAATSSLTLFIMFPLLSLVGFGLAATQAQPAQVRTVSLISSGALLLLSIASAAALVLGASSLLPPPSHTLPLWFVLAFGLVIGPIGAASYGRPSSRTEAGT
ncbi:MAG: hypothetical protein K0R03_2585 [Moraxellaceae bacterium]|jgi:hypothetical protein|nr:hypothetical protein [Moraxellaceae bacterium]